MHRIILASGSPRRKELLERIDIPFIIMVSGVEENSFGYTDASTFAKDMAHNKAIDILKKYRENLISNETIRSEDVFKENQANIRKESVHDQTESNREKSWLQNQHSESNNEEIWVQNQLHEPKEDYILAADTIVVKDGLILGKPTSESNARDMLQSLSGEWHEVITGISLISVITGKEIIDTESTRVKFRNISEDLLNKYCSTPEPYDKAGAYGIQGYGSLIVEKIEGDYCNVMGLPVQKVSNMLEKMGIQPLSWL